MSRLLYNELNGVIKFGMSNGHIISGEFKGTIQTNTCPFLIVESKIFGRCLLAEDDISYFMVDQEAQQYQNLPSTTVVDNEFLENIKNAKKKYRQTEFVAKHPSVDGMDNKLFKPRIEE